MWFQEFSFFKCILSEVAISNMILFYIFMVKIIKPTFKTSFLPKKQLNLCVEFLLFFTVHQVFSQFLPANKRYFMIDQQIVQHFVHYSECLSNHPPFYATQIISSFLSSRISANHVGILANHSKLMLLNVPLV